MPRSSLLTHAGPCAARVARKHCISFSVAVLLTPVHTLKCCSRGRLCHCSELLLALIAVGTLVGGALWAGRDATAKQRGGGGSGDGGGAASADLPAQEVTPVLAAVFFVAASAVLLLLYLFINYIGIIMVRRLDCLSASERLSAMAVCAESARCIRKTKFDICQSFLGPRCLQAVLTCAVQSDPPSCMPQSPCIEDSTQQAFCQLPTAGCPCRSCCSVQQQSRG